MQCRICFEDGDATTLVTPCRCRGSSAYIHQTCLDRYIQYYPDRICRVCHDEFPHIDSPLEISLCFILFTSLGVALFFSLVSTSSKLFLLGVSALACMYLLHRHLFGYTPLVFVFIIGLLILPGGHPSATSMWYMIIGMIALFYTFSRQLPSIVLLGIIVTLMLAGYVVFLTMFAYHSLDPPAFAVYLSVLYLLWYAWVHDQQPILRLPTA